MIKLLLAIFGSSIGKKSLMALTGLGAIGFLLVHLGGNLLIYGGRDEFNSYARHLHSVPVLPVLEIALFAMFALHAVLGIATTIENFRARPVAYAVRNTAGASNVASSTMIYSGGAVLVFLVLHMITIRTGATSRDAYAAVLSVFHSPFGFSSYVFGILALGFHLFHGVSSSLQSFGLSHAKYEPFITVVGRTAALAFAVGFVSIPFYVILLLGRTG